MSRHKLALSLCMLFTCLSWAGTPHIAAQDQKKATEQPAELKEADRLSQQVLSLYYESRYDEAMTQAERVLAIRERVLGPDHEDVATALHNLASVCVRKGEYVRALALYKRALSIREKKLGPDHEYVSITLNGIGALYDEIGDYGPAEEFLQRGLAIREKVLGHNHEDVATVLNNLAEMYKHKGDYEQAHQFYRRALYILEKKLGPDHPLVAKTLNNQAGLYMAQEDYDKAIMIHERAIEILKKTRGENHVDVVLMRGSLAELYLRKGDYARAESLYKQALLVSQIIFGPMHSSVGRLLNNLALVYHTKGDYAEAEPLYLQALRILEKSPADHQEQIGLLLTNLAAVYRGKGDYAQAVEFMSRGQEVREHTLSQILATGSERQQRAYMETLLGETYAAVSLHAVTAPLNPRALHLALTTILRRKGRVLDSVSSQVAQMRRRLEPQSQKLFDQLAAAQSELSTLVLRGPAQTSLETHTTVVLQLEDKIERLQTALNRSTAEFREKSPLVTIEQVQKALPPDAALVEFFYYEPVKTKWKGDETAFNAPRYIAYVLLSEGAPLWADLGEVSNIHADLAALLRALKCPQTVDDITECLQVPAVKRMARALDQRVMRPVRNLLGSRRHIFLAPDGALNLLSFGALVDENNKYVIENYSLTYLTSGRDLLLSLRASAESQEPPAIFANPAFGKVELSKSATGLLKTNFEQLPHSREEARTLATILPGARMFAEDQATETALKQLRRPRILHLATHGFFLPDLTFTALESTHKPNEPEEAFSDRMLRHWGNPLLRSGLALAGANSRSGSNGDDGILTALEMAGLDLWGTKLVVLSACETGVGGLSGGEGIYGLRRALVMAGSESQLISLWKVSDVATKELMVDYYKRLQAGEGRTDALRQVQLKMLAGKTKGEYIHPYYWAAFIQSGDWRRLNYSPRVAPK